MGNLGKKINDTVLKKHIEMFILTQKILKAYRENGLVIAEVFGKQGVGKTTYALKVLREVYKELGYEDPWGEALSHTFFDIKDALPILKESVDNNKRIPAILFDDAGTWLIKYSWYQQDMKSFIKLFNLIRTLTAGLIFTTPHPDDILKNIRDKTWYKIKVVRNGKKDGVQQGIAKHYRYLIVKKNSELKSVVDEYAWDFFRVHLPDPIYQRYEEMRREKGIKKFLEEVMKSFSEEEEQQKMP